MARDTYGWMVPALGPQRTQTCFKFRDDAEKAAVKAGRPPSDAIPIIIKASRLTEQHEIHARRQRR